MRFLLTFFFIAALLPGSYSYATEYTFEIAWTIEEQSDIELAGFRLYDLQRNTICETTDPAATEIICTADVTGTKATYTLVSYATDGTESDPSDPFTIIFETTSPLEAIISLTTVAGSLTVDFMATSSTGSITQYSWDFGDGTIDDNNPTPRHTFVAAGTYTVFLTVQDETGATAKTSQKITLSQPTGENQAPTASLFITSSVIGDAPLTVTFNAGGSSDPEGSALTYFWNFGDGTQATGSKLISHQYAVPGTYTTTVTITDNQGASHSTTSQPILVNIGDSGKGSATPTATITASRTSGPAPVVVTFTGAGSTPSEQTGSITQYSWNFGDGSTGSGIEGRHTFTEPGNYTVQLTVTDSSGRQAVTTKTLAVLVPGTQNIAPLLIPIYKVLILKN